MALTRPHAYVTGQDILASEGNNNEVTLFNAIGDQEYTEQNYIDNDESISDSLDALDMQLKDAMDSLSTGALSSSLFTQQSTAPTTISDQVALFAMEAANEAEAMLFMKRENEGTVLKLLTGTADHKTWVYSNTATPGWIIDTTITDRVLAIKGGSGDYNVLGGVQAGSWSHGHTVGNHTHAISYSGYSPLAYQTTGPEYATSSPTGGASGNTGDNTSFRPYAAVGTLQYPDMNA